MEKQTSIDNPPSVWVVRDIGKDLLERIHSGVFSSRGNAFSFDLGYVLEEREGMGFIDTLFGFNVKKTKGKNPSNELRAVLPRGVSFRIKESNTFLERKFSISTKRDDIECWGPVFEIVISEEYSKAFYKEKFGNAVSFCNHLLANYPKLVEKLLLDSISENRICIGIVKIGILSYGSLDDTVFSFSRYGMDSLPNIGCCYGLALAMVKIVEKESAKLAGATLTSLAYAPSYRPNTFSEKIDISFNLPKKNNEQHLHKWL